MLVLLAALAAQASCVPPAAVRAGAAADSGWRAYRRDAISTAARYFAAADSLCPGHGAARVGLGFVALRQGRVTPAARQFEGALARDSTDVDAWFGLGLARLRQGAPDQAAAAWRRTLALAPGYAEAREQLALLGGDTRGPQPRVLRPDTIAMPARTAGEHFEVRATDGWHPFYVKGVNLGAALPGKFPSEFPTDDSAYARWLALIAAANANTLRVYTILPPPFYRALRRWNDAHPDHVLWLVHGVWAELPPHNDYDDARWKKDFRAEERRVADVVHGHALLAARPGHASGRYDADVSDHVLAFILGREWEPASIGAYNGRRRHHTSYAGRFLAVARGTPADVWMAEQCDALLAYEWDTYHAQRPVAYTNWPTLDPLHHVTEPTQAEEQVLRRRHGFPPHPRPKEYDNDRESLDAMLVRTTPANHAGYFAAYHAYPYYPDFVALDSGYGSARSPEGPSHYFGYLLDLKRHHAGRALLIAEYGVPSSRGVSHWQPEGFDHGGHDEGAMATLDARLTNEIHEAGLAGGILFSWLDEWFKHTWVTIDLELPAERTRLWHNVMDAEQHYGLLGEYAGDSATTPEPGGSPGPWRALERVGGAGVVGLRAGADASYLYLALEGGPPLDSLRYLVGLNTYAPDRGEFRLPGVVPAPAVGVDFLLALNDTTDAQLFVAPWYNPYVGPRRGMGPTGLDAFYNPRATIDTRSRDGVFDSLFVTTNRWRIGRDARTYPARGVNRGRLRFGRASASSLADWYADRDARLVEVRLPWAVLNVTDPSSRRVMVRIRKDYTFETARTAGVRFVVAAVDRAGRALRAWVPATRLYVWPTWDVPTWHERLKPAYGAMRDTWGAF